MLKIEVDSFNFVYGVNGGRRFHNFQIKWLNKHNNVLTVDFISIINGLRLESNYKKVDVIDVNIKQIIN